MKWLNPEQAKQINQGATVLMAKRFRLDGDLTYEVETCFAPSWLYYTTSEYSKYDWFMPIEPPTA